MKSQIQAAVDRYHRQEFLKVSAAIYDRLTPIQVRQLEWANGTDTKTWIEAHLDVLLGAR